MKVAVISENTCVGPSVEISATKFEYFSPEVVDLASRSVEIDGKFGRMVKLVEKTGNSSLVSRR